MLMIIVLAAIVILAAVLIFAATRPDTFRVERSADIKASPEQVFVQINDLHNWRAWSTWEKMDPNMKKTFSGSAQGRGAAYAWEGNRKVGKGSMEIVESKPHEFIAITLEFIKPFRGTNRAEFSFKPEGNQTRVTWTNSGKNNFIGKAVFFFTHWQ